MVSVAPSSAWIPVERDALRDVRDVAGALVREAVG